MAFSEILNSEEYFAKFASLSDKQQLISTQFNEGNFVDNLIALRELLKLGENREVTSEVIFRVLSSVLGVFSEQLKEVPSFTPKEVAVLTEVFRVLRNACAGCERNQHIIKKDERISEATRDICCYFLRQEKRTETELVLLRCASQFLGNAVTGSSENQESVWKLFVELYRPLILIEDGSLFNYTCMVVFNCLKYNENMQQLLHSDEGHEIVKALLKQSREYEAEWGLFVMEELLLQDDFLKCVYTDLNFTEKETLLEVLLYKLKSSSEDNPPSNTAPETVHIGEGNLLHICEQFISEAHTVLKISQTEDVEKLEPVLVKNHLECLCLTTSQRDLYSKVTCDVRLLTAAVNLLHCMKAIGESSHNAFSEVNKMSSNNVSDVDHPVFGLKRDLIRLVSNMAYKNKQNQDKVRELGGISLILDHTNIDGRNPFITQWSVFAIKNLCDNNLDNQAVIAGLKLEGVADNIEQLRMYGVEAEVQGDKVVIKHVSQQPRE